MLTSYSYVFIYMEHATRAISQYLYIKFSKYKKQYVKDGVSNLILYIN